jgi:hypothetical protein
MHSELDIKVERIADILLQEKSSINLPIQDAVSKVNMSIDDFRDLISRYNEDIFRERKYTFTTDYKIGKQESEFRVHLERNANKSE